MIKFNVGMHMAHQKCKFYYIDKQGLQSTYYDKSDIYFFLLFNILCLVLTQSQIMTSNILSYITITNGIIDNSNCKHRL